jgi:hypothetical protein
MISIKQKTQKCRQHLAFSMMSLAVTILLLLAGKTACAIEEGEIISVSREGMIRFYTGEVSDLQIGEELRVASQGGDSNIYLIVRKIDPFYAEGEITQLQIGQSGFFRPIQAGQLVKLHVAESKLKQFSFFVGGNASRRVGEFGGSHYFLGLAIAGPLKDSYYWSLRVQADSLGLDADHIEKRRAAYMLGLGYRLPVQGRPLSLAAHLGMIDTMTITPEASQTHVDPYTGASYPAKGVSHSNDLAYMISASYQIDLTKVNRNRRVGFSVSPVLTYADTIRTTAYPSYVSYGVALDCSFE